MKLRAIKVVYSVLLIAVLFVVSKHVPFGDLFKLSQKISVVQLGILLILLSLFTWIGISFWACLVRDFLGKRIGWLEAFGQHSLMSLGKYLPSGVLGILGRHHMLTKLGASHSESIGLLFNEQMLTVSAGIFIGSLMLLIGWGVDNPVNSTLAAFAFAACFTFPVFFNQLVKMALAYLPHKPLYLSRMELAPNYHANMMYAAMGWLMQSTLFLLLLEFLVSPDLSAQQWVLLAGLQCLSVLVGLLAIFAPVGIGVREAVLVALGMAILPKYDLLLVAVAHRLVLMLWDFVVGFFGSSLRLLFKDKAESGSF